MELEKKNKLIKDAFFVSIFFIGAGFGYLWAIPSTTQLVVYTMIFIFINVGVLTFTSLYIDKLVVDEAHWKILEKGFVKDKEG